MKSDQSIYKWPISLGKKTVYLVLILFAITHTQAQNISPEYQLKVLKINLAEPALNYSDSLIQLPSTIEFKHKIFLNDTIENPNSIKETTTIHFEEKAILLTNPNSTFLFQVKTKRVDYYENELIEQYYCNRGGKPYIVIVTKTGVYIRRANSYYSSFFYHKES